MFHDPLDWGLIVSRRSFQLRAVFVSRSSFHAGQILCDIIQSDGIVGGPYVDPRTNQDPVELGFANPDLLWKSNFPRPRLGQGGFKVAFQGIYQVGFLPLM